MNKIIYLLLTISALMPLLFDVAKVQAVVKKPEIVAASYKPVDIRIRALQNVLSKYNSPLAPHAATYVTVADKYGVDWKLLPSIAGLESSFGKRQLANSHNSYGWGGGRIYFASYEEGINKILNTLKTKYYDRGADTVYKIAPIYAESPTWAPRVTKFMDQFEAEKNRLVLEDLQLTI